MNCCCRSNLKFFGVLLLAGCCLDSVAAADTQIPNSQMTVSPAEPRVASLIHSSELLEQKVAASTAQPYASQQQDQFWGFPSEEAEGPVLHLPAVVRLPPITTEDDSSVLSADTQIQEPIASLLPPQAILAPPSKADEHFADIESLLLTEIQEPENRKSKGSSLSTEEQAIIDAVIRDSRAATTGVLTNARLNELAKVKIRRGYAMASRGAYYAARQELIEVLRMISQSKDAQLGEAKQTLALAAGLRALEEAVDFAPRGTQLEADLVIEVICASHRTPVARQLKSTKILPRQMMDCYFRYAQLKLAAAVKGEAAGSMALHALGKLTSRLNKVEPEKQRLALRRAVAYQQASLLAHNQNHLAAHELAVLLADSGHYVEAEQLLLQVVPREPNAIVYRNLAKVQESLGQVQQAAANRQFAQQLLRQGTSGMNNVQWMSPENFARTGGYPTRYAASMSRPPMPQPTTSPQQQIPAPTRNWR